MKKLLSAFLAGLMLFGSASAVFAEDAPEARSDSILASTSRLFISDLGYVDGIDGTITVGELKGNFANAVAILGADGIEKGLSTDVATDDYVTGAGESLRALIYGDVDRNAAINIADATGMLKHIAGWNIDVSTDAADVDKSGDVNLSDVTKLLKKIAGWDDISLGNVRMIFENKPLTAENEAAGVQLYFKTPLIKLARSNTKHTGEHAYKMKLARNESESCQFFLTSDKSMEGLTVELSPFEHEYGEGTLTGEMFIHYYYELEVHTNTLVESAPEIVENDEFVEPLLPLADSFELTEGKSQGFNINVTADKYAPEGMYKAVLSVKDAQGNVIKCANVYTYVWDFTLPDTPYSKSSFGMSGYSIYAELGSMDKKWHAGDDHKTHAEHYDFLLDHNISAYQLPYPIMDERADAYMSDPRVTSFEIGGENLRHPSKDNWETTMANWNKVQSNPVWAEKGHFYYVDEPFEPGYALVQSQHEFLTDKLKTDDFDIILPFFNSMVDNVKNIDMLEFIIPYVDIFVPRSDGFHANLEMTYRETPWTPRQAFIKYGESLPRLKAIQKDPEKELWWYVCIEPSIPYPNLFTTQQGNMNRVIWWQQFIFDTEGFLYWSTQSGWEGIRKAGSSPGVGDGLLMYLGERFGRTGPVASYRLIQIRDGFDDFDYLKMAEELVGREAVMKVVSKLTTDVLKVNEDPDVMESCRDAIAKLILDNQY